jgi:hypothetical protein
LGWRGMCLCVYFSHLSKESSPPLVSGYPLPVRVQTEGLRQAVEWAVRRKVDGWCSQGPQLSASSLGQSLNMTFGSV